MLRVRILIDYVDNHRKTMRMNDDKSPLKLPEQAPAEQEVREEDPFHSWILFFLHSATQANNPRLSIYARILSGMQTHKTAQIAYMAVGFLQGAYVLMYNPEWAKRTTYTEFVATLAHEAMHILLRHIPRSMRRLAAISEERRGDAHHVMNVAMDATLNEQLAKHFPHMRTGVSGYWVFPQPLGLPTDSACEDLFEIMWAYRQALIDRMKEILEERKEKRKQQGADAEDGPQKPGGEEEGDTGEEGEEGEDQSGDDEEGEGEGNSEPETPDWKPGGKGFEERAQAMADLAEAQAHQWHLASDSDGHPTDEPATDFAHLDSAELEATATLLEEAGKQLVATAIRDHQKGRGTVPVELKAALDVILEEARVPWKTLLKNLVVARMLSSKKMTMTRPHKRRHILWFLNETTGLIERYDQAIPQYPGYNRDRTYVALFAIDTSGSMSKPDIAEGLAEMKGILKHYTDAHLIVVQCDTQISSVDIVGPDMDVDEYVEAIGRTSGGGTTFNDPFKLAKFMRGEGPPPRLPRREESLKKLAKYKTIDLIIYHTDGGGNLVDESLRPNCPTIWLCTHNAWENVMTFGHVIRR
jgi:predicted metal-dependent peptidase